MMPYDIMKNDIWYHMVSFLKYRYLGKFNHDLTVLPNPGIMVSIGNHPQMAELFRLVKYYSLPRGIMWYHHSQQPWVGVGLGFKPRFPKHIRPGSGLVLLVVSGSSKVSLHLSPIMSCSTV